MKPILLTILVSLSLAVAGARAENPVEKVEQDASSAAKKTESTVKKAAKKTDTAVKTAAEDTGATTKKAAKKTGEAVKTGADDAVKATEKTADKVAAGTKKAVKDVADSELFQKIEKELGKPFTPEQKAKYAEAWQAAQDKARGAEKEFAEKVSEITGLGKKKSKKIVSDQGL